jgi:hypothetical protein
VTVTLIEPSGDDEILDADREALRFSAIMTGDVFQSVSLGGKPDPITVMVAGHPCTIRGAHGALRPRVVCVRVFDYQHVPYRIWPTGHRNVFPIAASVGLGSVAADLQEWVTVDSTELRRADRKLTLTERGFVVLHQRVVASLTRVIVDPVEIERAAHHVLREAELERDWVEELDGTKPIEDLVADFAAFMDGNGRRDRLKAPELESAVRKEVRTQLGELRS